MKKEKSCGGVVIKKDDGDFLVLVIKHNAGHWSFPKGHVIFGESEEETARREILEEVGLRVNFIQGFRKMVTYSPRSGVIKDVVFFLAEANSLDVVLDYEEVCDYKWCTFNECFDIVTHDSDVLILNEVINFLNDLI